jgi:hypothetical protein
MPRNLCKSCSYCSPFPGQRQLLNKDTGHVTDFTQPLGFLKDETAPATKQEGVKMHGFCHPGLVLLPISFFMID